MLRVIARQKGLQAGESSFAPRTYYRKIPLLCLPTRLNSLLKATPSLATMASASIRLQPLDLLLNPPRCRLEFLLPRKQWLNNAFLWLRRRRLTSLSLTPTTRKRPWRCWILHQSGKYVSLIYRLLSRFKSLLKLSLRLFFPLDRCAEIFISEYRPATLNLGWRGLR